jgi:protein-S-isoprenylcysteine O-methyltransferase Ste14
MWLSPVFEIGLWNAWIFMLIFFVLMFIPDLLNALHRGKGEKDFAIFPPLGKTEGLFSSSWGVIFMVGFIFSIFLPLRLGTTWLSIGLIIILPGLIIWTVVIHNIVTTPQGKPFTKGAYRYSRHPMFIAQFLLLVGISIGTTSLIFLSLSVILIILAIVSAHYEERSCLKHFGDSYREYLNRTPRWIGMPRSGKREQDS